jgi:tetratricopeptide (TPR) repeat protein
MKTLLLFSLLWMITELAVPPSVTMTPVHRLVGTTENPEARKDFQRGLLLLHNFEYPDAADKFRSAREKDPLFALAYWGEAMTYNHPVWLSQDAERARNVLAQYTKAKGTDQPRVTSLDKDLLTSVEILYGKGSKAERDAAYADFMGTLYNKYPDNHDVAAFYSLSLLGKAAGWDEALCNEAARIARGLLKRDPNHPGALHYFIHAQDHPEFARLAWDAANSYSTVASYSGHALHMPSHIYLALGRWDDVVKSNEVSWQAGVDRKESRGLDNNALNYHAHWWLTYGYLQQGRFSKAEERVRNQLSFTKDLSSPVARTHFVIMRGHYLTETNDWQNSLLHEEVKIQDLRVEIRSLDRFIKGLKAYRDGNKSLLTKIVEEINKDVSSAGQALIINDGMAQCNAASGSGARTGVNQASILLEELRALLAVMNNDVEKASSHFQRAIAIEDENGHFFGPPEVMKPSYEFYGEFLLQQKKHTDAVKAFEKALSKAPGRNQSLSGLKLALQRSGNATREKQITDQLNKNLSNSETPDITGFFPLR